MRVNVAERSECMTNVEVIIFLVFPALVGLVLGFIIRVARMKNKPRSKKIADIERYPNKTCGKIVATTFLLTVGGILLFTVPHLEIEISNPIVNAAVSFMPIIAGYLGLHFFLMRPLEIRVTTSDDFASKIRKSSFGFIEFVFTILLLFILLILLIPVHIWRMIINRTREDQLNWRYLYSMRF